MINANNREQTIFITYNGASVSLRLLLMEKGLSDKFYAIYGRLKRGWDHQKAIDTPIRKGNYKRKIAA